MKKLFSLMVLMFLAITAISAMVGMVTAGPSDTVAIYPISADPCANPSTVKSSAVISAATNTTSQLVALTVSKSIYICDLSTSLTGTTGNDTSFQLVSGTTTTIACDTGQVNVSGIYKVNSQAAGQYFHLGYSGTIMKVASGKALCSKNTGTNSVLTGTITYVVQ